jgi:hypothetical protein
MVDPYGPTRTGRLGLTRTGRLGLTRTPRQPVSSSARKVACRVPRAALCVLLVLESPLLAEDEMRQGGGEGERGGGGWGGRGRAAGRVGRWEVGSGGCGWAGGWVRRREEGLLEGVQRHGTGGESRATNT